MTLITITADDPNEEIVAKMLYNVGWALSCWGHVEEALTSFYAAMTIPKGFRSEGAITTFREIRTLDQKIIVAGKVLKQVFYADNFSEFRLTNKRRLNRIQKLNETRNKIAHGRVLYGGFGGSMGPRFGPYYIEAVHMRSDFMASTKVLTDVVDTQEIWTLEELERHAFSLREGRAIVDEMLADFDRLVVEHADRLHAGGWIVMERGLPPPPHTPNS